MESAIIKKISLKRGRDVIKRIEINTKKEWVSIEEKVEKDVDKNPLIS
jgi:hypothetical protein